jgi:DNA-binding transcriptional MerR regulator
MKPTLHCAKCGALKVVVKNGSRRCMPCSRKRSQRYYQESQLWRDKKREWRLLRLYGISLEQLTELLVAQDSKCAICRKQWQDCDAPKKALHDESFLQYLYVDHDHNTGNVRGLLCNACNFAIGLFEDDALRIVSAIEYLHRTALP